MESNQLGAEPVPRHTSPFDHLASAGMVLKAGGPCGICGCTEASAWYGKPPGPRSCKKGACRRALGFAAPLQGGKRGRSGSMGSADEEDEDSAGDLFLHELEAIYGSRFCCFACAPSTHHSLNFFPCSLNLHSHVCFPLAALCPRCACCTGSATLPR